MSRGRQGDGVSDAPSWAMDPRTPASTSIGIRRDPAWPSSALGLDRLPYGRSAIILASLAEAFRSFSSHGHEWERLQDRGFGEVGEDTSRAARRLPTTWFADNPDRIAPLFICAFPRLTSLGAWPSLPLTSLGAWPSLPLWPSLPFTGRMPSRSPGSRSSGRVTNSRCSIGSRDGREVASSPRDRSGLPGKSVSPAIWCREARDVATGRGPVFASCAF